VNFIIIFVMIVLVFNHDYQSEGIVGGICIEICNNVAVVIIFI